MKVHPGTYTEWRLWSYRLPLVRPLNWGGSRQIHREGLLLGLCHRSKGWRYGEAAPLPGFCAESLAETREALLARLRGAAATGCPSAEFALESAHEWGGLDAGPVVLNGLVDGPIGDFERIAGELSSYVAVKVKCAIPDAQAMAMRVDLLASFLPEAFVRVDANRLFPPGEGVEFLRLLEGLENLDYVEEPYRDLFAGLALPDDTAISVAADESARENWALIERDPDAVDVLVVKPTWNGGLTHTQRMLGFGASGRRRVVMSSALESGVGLRNLAALIRSRRLDREAHGLDTLRLLAEDVLAEPARIEDGVLHFPAAVNLNPNVLQEIAHGAHPLFAE